MASKEVTDRERSTTIAVSMLNTYADPVRDGAAAALSGYLEAGETMPDFGLVAKLVARMMSDRGQKLRVADEANEREAADDVEPRRQRDLHVRGATDLLISIRDTVGAIYGDAGLAVLGLSDPCPSTALAVAKYGRSFITALRDEEKVRLPPPRSRGLVFQRAVTADELEAEIAPLEAALGSVAIEESEAKGAQSAKDRALEANDEGFSIGTGIARHVFRLCGLSDIADKIRESPRGHGQLATPTPVPNPANGDSET